VTRTTRLGTLIVAAIGLLVFAADPALAETSISVAAPSEAAIGDTVPVIVTVTEDGVPLPGETVTLSRNATFGGVSGYMETARATTGEDGTADLSYVQRQAGQTAELRVELVDSDVEPLDFVVMSFGEPTQIFRSDVGVDLPGLGGWILIALIAGLWAVILAAVLRLRGVSAEGSGSSGEAKRERRVIPYALPTIVVVVAAVLVTILVRNPATHGNIIDPDISDRVPHSHVGEIEPMPSPGLDEAFAEPTGDVLVDGGRAFFGLGCASCHGLDGVSGVVGGDLSDPVEEGLADFLLEVRRGPKGMPEYSKDAFSDEELALIHTYLVSLLDG